MPAPHDRPSAFELLEAVREWLMHDVQPQGGATGYHARVAANILAVVARELDLGPAQAAAHRHRLSHLGVVDDRELADAIRHGRLDDRLDEVRAVVRRSVADKLAVANPGYLPATDRPLPAQP